MPNPMNPLPHEPEDEPSIWTHMATDYRGLFWFLVVFPGVVWGMLAVTA